MLPVGDLSAFIGGFVAAEGSFFRTSDRFAFAVTLGAQDAAMCAMIANVVGVGRVYRYPKRRPHFDDEARITVQAMRELVERVIPFMDANLPRSNKREQYLKWREDLLEYWEHAAKRRRPCTIDGCSKTRRAKGLCRHHYYERYGK